MSKWLAGLAATIIAGVVIWALTHPGGFINVTPTPTPKLSFLEKVAATYTLTSWTDTHTGSVELGAKVTSGTLRIDQNGLADWDVLVEQAFISKPGKVRMTARGQIQLDSRMVGIQGGQFNKTSDVDGAGFEVSPGVQLAVRGWDNPDLVDRFTLALDTQARGSLILQMKNSKGIFTWKRKP
jgi:hypothetical protein